MAARHLRMMITNTNSTGHGIQKQWRYRFDTSAR
jgi:hypothetical protein